MTRQEFELKVNELRKQSHCTSYLNKFIAVHKQACRKGEEEESTMLSIYNFMFPYMEKEFDSYLKLSNEYLMSTEF